MTRPVSAYALLAMALGIACAPSPPEEPHEPPAPEPLWVGILRRDGAVIPIARYDRSHSATSDPVAELWDEPWPELFELEYLRFDRRTGAARVMEPRWVRDPGADSRLVWEESEQADWRPTMAAPVRWHLYADGESVATLDAEHLNVRGAHCMVGWALGAAANAEVEAFLNRTTARYGGPAGVVLSEVADAVLDEAEIPALEEIRQEAGMVDRTEEERRRRGEHTGLDYDWLGFFRFGSVVVGVANARGYEGEGYQVLEIQGDQGRLVADVHGGGC